MPTFQMGVAHHLNAYYQTSPLLFQFSFTEFFHIYQQFSSIEALLTEEQFNHSLFQLLARFCGPLPEKTKIFYWTQNNGSLSKMYHYAVFLINKCKPIYQNFPLLDNTCKNCWISGVELSEAIELQEFNKINQMQKKLRNQLRQMAKDLIRVAGYFKDNENVLYFFLRHNHQIDYIYGPKFTHQLLSSLFNKDLQEARNFIIDKYTLRGFGKLIEGIHDYFDHLDK